MFQMPHIIKKTTVHCNFVDSRQFKINLYRNYVESYTTFAPLSKWHHDHETFCEQKIEAIE